MKINRTNKDQLILQSIFTVTLLAELERHDFLKSDYYLSTMKFEDNFIQEALKSVRVGNFGVLVMCLYSMLVIAWELREDETREGFQQGNFEKDFSDAELFLKSHLTNIQSTYLPEITFLRHLRNSISHAKVELIAEQEKFIFRDMRGTKEKRQDFSAELSREHVGNLLQILYVGNLNHVKRLQEYEVSLS